MTIDKRSRTSFRERIGYSRREFNSIFQIYSTYVYKGLFKDFSFAEINGRYYISFKQDASHTPLITIEKRKMSADRVLFVATAPDYHGGLKEIARSEKIDSFIRQLGNQVQTIFTAYTEKGGNVRALYR